MSEATEHGPVGSVGLATPVRKPRGRPKKPSAPLPSPLAAAPSQPDLIDLVHTLVNQQAKVLEQMTAAQTATTELMRTWMQMFTPTPTPARSTSADERALLAEERALAEWEPLDNYLDPKEVLRSLM